MKALPFRWLGVVSLVLLVAWACDDTAGTSRVPPDALPDAGSGEGGEGGARVDHPTPEAGTSDLPCNGRLEYCALRYGAVIQPTSNAAMAFMRPPFGSLHQNEPVLGQLRLGVQALALEVHEVDGEAMLCLGRCAGGSLPLRVVLDDVAEFLDENPRYIVTLLVDAFGAGASFARTFAAHRVASRLHRLGATPFATLGELVEADERLVVLVRTLAAPSGEDGAGGSPGADPGGEGGEAGTAGAPGDGRAGAPSGGAPSVPVALDRFDDYAFKTSGVDSPEALTCSLEAGSEAAPLYAVTHVQSAPADASTDDLATNAAALNTAELVESRLRYCNIAWERWPSFVIADDIDAGGVIQAAQTLTLEAARAAAP